MEYIGNGLWSKKGVTNMGVIFNLKIQIYVCVCERHYIHTITLPHVLALKGPTSGSTDILREHGQRNACPDVNIRLKSSVLCVTWQLYKIKWAYIRGWRY